MDGTTSETKITKQCNLQVMLSREDLEALADLIAARVFRGFKDDTANPVQTDSNDTV